MLPYTEKMMRSNGWSKVRPPVWYWLIVAIVLVVLYLFSGGDAEGAQSPSQSDIDRLKVVRAIEGIEKAEGRQARALEGILKELGKMKSCR